MQNAIDGITNIINVTMLLYIPMSDQVVVYTENNRSQYISCALQKTTTINASDWLDYKTVCLYFRIKLPASGQGTHARRSSTMSKWTEAKIVAKNCVIIPIVFIMTMSFDEVQYLILSKY